MSTVYSFQTIYRQISSIDIFFYNLELLTFDRGTCLSLAHLDVAVAVRSRYMKGSGDQETSLHRLMAGYFLQLVDPERDGSYTGNSVRAFSELPYHLVQTVNRWIDKMID